MVVTFLTHQIEPTCFNQAVKQEEWRLTMSAEFNALIQASTWELVPSSSSMNILPNKWVYRIKRKPDGSVERYKAWLVAKGFQQQEGIDYGETFSPLRSSFLVGHPSWDCSSINMLNLGVPILSEAVKPPKGLILDWR
ncbi:hypothetical protein ACLB2K_035917 [Fragaria x ananassa]